MSKIRRRENPIIKEPEVKKPEPGKVVLSSDDIAPREDKSSEEIALDNMIAEDLKKSQEQPVITSDVVVEPIQENTPEVVEETEESDESEPKVYTEDQLSKFSKAMLLEISNDYGLDCSDINTKKEIREAILKAQNK
jgi:hypothetical protein